MNVMNALNLKIIAAINGNELISVVPAKLLLNCEATVDALDR